MNPIHLSAVGIAAPGLDGWAQAARVLRGEQPLLDTPLPPHQPTLLPPNERRRATQAVRLAFRVAEDALAHCSLAAADLAGVFASSDADTQVLHRLCTALATEARVVSPTDFHNSVHNAAPGYWSIANGSRAPSVSLSAWDASFTAGLLEAAALVQAEHLDVLLVAYDLRPPAPLYGPRIIDVDSGVALVLSARAAPAALASLLIERTDEAESGFGDAALEALRGAGTALRALPLLHRVARRDAGSLVLAGPGSMGVRVTVTPC